MLRGGGALGHPALEGDRRRRNPSFAGGDSYRRRVYFGHMALPAPESTLEGIEELAHSELSAQEFIEEAAERISRVVPTDGHFFSATDPETTLAMGPGVIKNLPFEMCQTHWDYEFMVPDYLKFADIAQSPTPLVDLHDATGGRPERSPRWREFGGYTGLRSEVRMAFTVDGAAWGVGQLNRKADAPRFSDEEKAWLARVVPAWARASAGRSWRRRGRDGRPRPRPGPPGRRRLRRIGQP